MPNSGGARFGLYPNHDRDHGDGVCDSYRPSRGSGDDVERHCPSSSRHAWGRVHPSEHRGRHGS
jgi:hypothetical protein